MKTTLSLREKLLLGLVEKTKPWYGQFFQKSKTPWKVSLEKLKKFPKATLGNDLAQFLEKENLSLMPKFESHDVYHVLFKYKTTVIDEARMQFFLMGNRKYSFYVIGSNLLAPFFFPEEIRSFFQEFKKGRKALSIAKWDFEFLLNEPTKSLRKMIFQQTDKEKYPFVF